MIIGIFKVNDFEDGGYYTDVFFHKILQDNNHLVSLFAFHNSKKDLQHHTNIRCNHKNPIDALITIGKTIRENRISTVYTCQFICYLYLLLLRFFFPIYIITKVDGLTTKRGHKKYTFFLYDLIYVFIIKFADYVIYETELAYKNLKESGRRKNTEVIYTPATNFYQTTLPEISFNAKTIPCLPIVLFIGRYSEEKGYQFLGEIARKNQRCQFILIGGYKNHYPDVENIKELGRLDITEIIPWYQKAHVLIVPSVCDSFPSVIREFAYFGKPIIATNVGAMNEFKKMGMDITIVLPNIDRLSEAIQEIQKNYHFSQANCSVYNQHFNPNNTVVQERYLNIFEKYSIKVI
jgi:glycosyltransferase involved in cell wall biosynthesis